MLKQAFDPILLAFKGACLTAYGERLVSLAVFGSVAANRMKPDSDIDALLVCDPLPGGRIPRVREFEAVDRLCAGALEQARAQGVNTTLSPLIKTPAEVLQGSLLFLDMTDTVRILHDRERFLALYLQSLKERLAEMGSKRVRCGGGYYWLLRPDLRAGEDIVL